MRLAHHDAIGACDSLTWTKKLESLHVFANKAANELAKPLPVTPPREIFSPPPCLSAHRFTKSLMLM